MSSNTEKEKGRGKENKQIIKGRQSKAPLSVKMENLKIRHIQVFWDASLRGLGKTNVDRC